MNTNKLPLKKKLFLLSFSFLLFSSISFAQRTIEITPSYGYHFGGKTEYYGGYLQLDASDQWGVNVAVEIQEDIMAEIYYARMGTQLNIRDVVFSPIESRLSDLSVDWIMVGGNKYFTQGNIKPFLGGAVGVGIFTPSNENNDLVGFSLDTTTKFSFAFKGGVNIMFNERLGLNLQGNLMVPVQWGGVYVGTGGGGVSVGSTIVVGGFSGGLVFLLN